MIHRKGHIMQERKIMAPLLRERLSGRHRPLIAAHKGSAGGNVMPNTVGAFTAAIRQGADIVECDVARTSDGTLILFHDGTEPLYLGIKQNVRTLSYPQLLETGYVNCNNNRTNQKVQEFRQALQAFKGKTLFNVDRGWDHWDSIVEEIERQGMAAEVLLKSPPRPDLLARLESYPKKYMYMPIVSSMEDFRAARGHEINTVAVELIFASAESDLARPEFLKSLKEEGILAWCNSLKLSDRHFFCGEFDDDVSILQGPEKGWGRLLDLGFDILQTDWPAILRDYLNGRYGG